MFGLEPMNAVHHLCRSFTAKIAKRTQKLA